MRHAGRSSCVAAVLSVVSSGILPSLAAEPESQAAGPQLEEIVVTAQKREQSLNNVGLTVDALSGDTLKNRQINSLQDLTLSVPSLTYANSFTGTPIITLRGVGYYETSLSAYPAVTLYMDQVPLTFPVLATHTNFDLERVEVLKGPQGTLFGQNSTGGAINFIPAKPTKVFEIGTTVSYGRFNSFDQESYVSGPVSDGVSVRVSERTETADGWQRSNSRPGDSNGAINNQMGRILVDFDPTDRATFEFDLNGWKDRSQPEAAQFIGVNNQHPTPDSRYLNPVVASTPFSPHTPQAADWNPNLPKNDEGFYQASLRGDIKLTDDLTLSSITAYANYHQTNADDADGLPVPEDDFPANNGKITTISQELRLANAATDRVRWLVGANYEHDIVDQYFFFDYSYSSTPLATGASGYPVGKNPFFSDQKMRTYAAFANVEADVSDTVTLKAGARYTDTKEQMHGCGTDTTPPYYAGRLFYDILAGGGSGPYVPGDCFPINNFPYTVNGVASGQPGEFAGSLDQNNVSWRVGIDWKPSPGMLFYANIAKGFKAGGFPTVGASVFTQYVPVVQESILSYEPGFKLTLLDKRLQLNGAAFYYNYRDKQLRSRTIDPVFGALDILQNIPKSSVRGAELELVARPTEALTVSASATYLDAKIDEFTGVSESGISADFAGTAMPYTPKTQFALNGDYVVPLRNAVSGFAGATVTYQSSTYSIIGGNENPTGAYPTGAPLFRIDGYTLVDLRLGVESDKWRVFLWGKNVFNKYYWNSVNASNDTIVRFTGMPATYGITASYKVK
jgi:iron complex outermembrane receptor protein